MDHLREMQYLEGEVKKVLGEIQAQLSRISPAAPSSNDFEKVSERLGYVKSRIRAMEVEQLQIEDRQEARKFIPIIKDLQDQVKEIEQNLLWTNGGRRMTQEDKMRDKYGDITKNEQGAIQYGRDMQDRQHDLADRAIEIVVETEEKAKDTAEKVHQQTQQLQSIDKNLSEIDNELDRATKIIRRIGRRVITDKYIMCLLVLVFAALIAVIVLAAEKKNVGSSQPSTTVSPGSIFPRSHLTLLEFD